MSYFSQILGGNIPITVIQTIEGFQQDYMLNKKLGHYQINRHTHGHTRGHGRGHKHGHYQINEGMTNDLGNYPINEHKIMNSPYGAYVTASLEMDRQKVGTGLMAILKTASSQALIINRDNLVKISKMGEKLSEQESKLVNDTVNKFSSDLAQLIVNMINKLSMDKKMKELLVHTIHLTGVTSKNKKDMEASVKQIIMIMELHHQFKTYKSIDMLTSLKLKLVPENLKKCGAELIRDCVFDDEFLFKFTSALMDSLEHILGSIMNAVKYDKVCEFYAFSVELANQLSNGTNIKPKVIETLLDAGNSTKLSDSTKIKDLKEINKNIDQSKVINGMSKLISDVVNDVVSKNSADLMRTIAVSNKIAITGGKGVSFSFKNIIQSVQMETNVEADFTQKIAVKIQNEIANKVRDTIDSATKQFDKDVRKSILDEKSGTNIGGVIGGVVNALGDAWGKTMETVGKVLSVSAGNSMEQSTSKDISQEMKDTFNLNQGFKYEKTDEAKNAISNVLKSDNLSKCVADSKTANEIDLGKIDVTGPIEIDNIKQEAVVKDVMNCAFNQEVINDIASKVFNDFDKLIKALIENVNDKLTDEQKTAVQGDIYAVGTAGSAILESAGKTIESAGKAAKDLGEGLSTAAQGAGKGLGSAAEGIGKGIGNVLSGLTAPFIIGGIILVLLIIAYVLYKIYGPSSNDGDDGVDGVEVDGVEVDGDSDE